MVDKVCELETSATSSLSLSSLYYNFGSLFSQLNSNLDFGSFALYLPWYHISLGLLQKSVGLKVFASEPRRE